MTKEQINKEFSRKVRAGIFNPVRRYLTNSYTAEDRWQEAVALTWLMYMRNATRGKVLDDGILVQKCRWTATDLSRRFVPAGDTQPYKDALDPRAFRDGRVTVYRQDGIDDENTESDRALQVGLAEAMAASPERKLNSAHDLRRWVGDLSFRDQAILQLKMAGYTLEQIATSWTWASARSARGRRRWASSWPDAPGCASTSARTLVADRGSDAMWTRRSRWPTVCE